MQKSKLAVLLFFSITLLMGMGCDLDPIYRSDTVLSDPKDHIFPIEPGIYLMITEFGGSLPSDKIKKHLSPAEQALLLTQSYIPMLPEDEEEPIRIEKFRNCYSMGFDKETCTLAFEKISDNFYLVEWYGGPSKEQGHKSKTDYSVVSVKNNHLYMIYDNSTDFEKWAMSLNRSNKLRYGIQIEEKNATKTVKLSKTIAIKVYYKENVEILAAAMSALNSSGNGISDKASAIAIPFVVSSSEVMKYEDRMKLDSKIRAIKKQIEIEEANERAELQRKQEADERKKEAEKNDGVIRYAFGRKLGEIKPSKYDSIAYFTITKSVEKSPYFQDYYELTTPETNQVFSIYGVSGCMSAEKCRQNAEKVMSILSAKYGAPIPHVPVEAKAWLSERDATDKSFLYFRRIEQKRHGRLIELLCVTDTNKIKLKNLEYQTNGCQLDANLYDESIAKASGLRHLYLSKYDLYHQYPGLSGYSDYGNSIIPISIPGDKSFNRLYPAPIPGLSASYNKYYRKCRLNEKNDIFRLFIRYSDTKLENLITKERENIKRKKEEIERKKKLVSPDAKGL